MTTPNLMNATSIVPQTLVFNGISGATYLDNTSPVGNVVSSYYTGTPGTTTGGIILYNPTGSNSIYKLNTGILDVGLTLGGQVTSVSDVGRLEMLSYNQGSAQNNFYVSNVISQYTNGIYATLEIARYNNGLFQYPIFKNQVMGCNVVLHKDSSIYMMEGDFLIVSAAPASNVSSRQNYHFTLSYEIIS